MSSSEEEALVLSASKEELALTAEDPEVVEEEEALVLSADKEELALTAGDTEVWVEEEEDEVLVLSAGEEELALTAEELEVEEVPLGSSKEGRGLRPPVSGGGERQEGIKGGGAASGVSYSPVEPGPGEGQEELPEGWSRHLSSSYSGQVLNMPCCMQGIASLSMADPLVQYMSQVYYHNRRTGATTWRVEDIPRGGRVEGVKEVKGQVGVMKEQVKGMKRQMEAVGERDKRRRENKMLPKYNGKTQVENGGADEKRIRAKFSSDEEEDGEEDLEEFQLL